MREKCALRRVVRGVTLIELMIAVVIVSIIAAIAYPSYDQYIRRARRAEAQTALIGLGQRLERHFTENTTYLDPATGTEMALGDPFYPAEAPISGTVKYYDLEFGEAGNCADGVTTTATSYCVIATPKGTQVGDGDLSLNSRGTRTWDRDGDGVIDVGEDCWQC